MRRIRALVVDDSAPIRRLLCEILGSDPGIEVVGTANDGRATLTLLDRVWADVITLDVEMPGMSGPHLLSVLQQRRPGQRVIVFSSLTRQGAAATLEALSLGASDYLPKPSQTGSRAAAQQQIRAELLPKIHALCEPLTRLPHPQPSLPALAAVHLLVAARPLPARPGAIALQAAPPRPRPARLPADAARPQIVAIGASTGGPNAVEALLAALPLDFQVPIVVAQHMPKIFTALFAERLAARTGRRVAEATDGAKVRQGDVWIAPGDLHLEVAGPPGAAFLRTHDGPRENSCRPAVDVLFRSLAASFGAGTLAVVLTGMGQDGLLGAQALRAAGAHLIAQDEASSVVWGMPGAVAAAGLGAQVLPLSAIAGELALRSLAQRGLASPARAS